MGFWLHLAKLGLLSRIPFNPRDFYEISTRYTRDAPEIFHELPRSTRDDPEMTTRLKTFWGVITRPTPRWPRDSFQFRLKLRQKIVVLRDYCSRDRPRDRPEIVYEMRTRWFTRLSTRKLKNWTFSPNHSRDCPEIAPEIRTRFLNPVL